MRKTRCFSTGRWRRSRVTRGVGAARSVFTGRGAWVSGRDMFLVGFGVAAVGYLIGELMARVLQ